MDTPTTGQWYLQGYIGNEDRPRLIVLEDFPVLVGRQAGLTLAGASSNMSRYHAELIERDGELVIRDLGSKNGTFVNREPVEREAAVKPGDVVHFADAEFRVGTSEGADADHSADTATAVIDARDLPGHFPTQGRDLEALIENRGIVAVYQPIVDLATGERVGQECLSRGNWDPLPNSPSHLLRVAESLGRAVELSELMRQVSVEGAGEAGLTGPTFVNIHPSEVGSFKRLLGQLWQLRKDWPELELVLELHEGAVTDTEAIEALHRQLRLFGIGLAYDDFGAGQARLTELTAVPPRYLKFDIELVRDLDLATTQRRRMVEMLVGFARECGIVTLAEGVSRSAEAEACAAIGFELAQGYYFGAPTALE